MHIDIKVSVWQRLHINEDQEELILDFINNGDLISESDLSNMGIEGSWKIIYETEEILNPEDNGGQATLEIWENKDDENPLFINGK